MKQPKFELSDEQKNRLRTYEVEFYNDLPHDAREIIVDKLDHVKAQLAIDETNNYLLQKNLAKKYRKIK